MTRKEFCTLTYAKQKEIFEKDILPQLRFDKRIWEQKLIDAIYSGNKEHLSLIEDLVPFWQTYCEQDKNIAKLNVYICTQI